jgi:hypothetical protein
MGILRRFAAKFNLVGGPERDLGPRPQALFLSRFAARVGGILRRFAANGQLFR